MKTYVVIFLIFSSWASQVQTTPSAEITNDKLKAIVAGYIHFVSRSGKKKAGMLTVWFRTQNDTVAVGMTDAYPDLSIARIRGIAKVEGYRVCLEGDVADGQFYRVRGPVTVPKDAIEANKRGILEEMGVEPVVWRIRFLGHRLLEYSPKEEVEKFVPTLKER